MAIPCRAGAKFPIRLCMLWISVQHGALSPIAQIHGSRNQGVEMGVVSLTITLSDPLANCSFPVPAALCSAGLGVWVPGGGILPPGCTTMIPLRLSPGHFGLLVPLNQQANSKREILSCLGWLIQTTKGKLDDCSTVEVRESVCKQEIP